MKVGSHRPVVVGVVGAGVISHAYLSTIRRSPDLELRAITSRSISSAAVQAARYGCTATSLEGLLADPAIEVVLNLAPPATHYEIGRSVLLAGKHLYSEKPFATSLEDASALLALAEERGLSVGCAPDTFLGDVHQAARRIVDDGAIGRVVAGSVAMASHGMESWHPNPAFFYARGGGPLLDIGPYYLTQLVNLLGPVGRVSAIATRSQDVRAWSLDGQEHHAPIEVPTTVNGALLFRSGANVSVSFSWDVWKHARTPIELYGDQGSLLVADPNGFSGSLQLCRHEQEWEQVYGAAPGSAPKVTAAMLRVAVATLAEGRDPLTGAPLGQSDVAPLGDLRGLGLIDLAHAIRDSRMPRANGYLARHVLEVLLGLEAAALKGCSLDIQSSPERPQPLNEPLG